MLKKLIKYDLIWINKFMLIYYSITLIVCLFTRFLSLIDNNAFIHIIYLIMRGVSISAYVSCIINSVIRIWVRFRNNTYKDESYLTNTLPAPKTTLFNSKMLSGLISIIIALFVVIIGFIIAFLNQDLIDYIKLIFSNNLFIFVSIIITACLEIIYMLGCGVLGILIGHRSNNNRVLKSVILGIILYFTIQTIIMLIIYLMGQFDNSLNVLFNNSQIEDVDNIKKLIIISDFIYIVFISVIYLIGRKIFLKGINVE
ncbi:MAG: hypothetical protein IKN63_01270 [Bacilli bacterium]|nr:hypothetical protein [Bacilli bacterium]